MSSFPTIPHSRRHFLAAGSLGLGSLATAWLSQQQQLKAAPARPELEPVHYDTLPKNPPGQPRASPCRDDIVVGRWFRTMFWNQTRILINLLKQ